MRNGTSRRFAWALALLGVTVVASPMSAGAAKGQPYVVHRLVSNQAGVAANTDPDLVNAWGLVSGPGTPWWVADNGSDKATLYQANGTKITAVEPNVPGAPTGQVFNLAGSGFVIHNGSASGPSRFMWSNENGDLLGWNPSVSPDAVVAVPTSGAIYKGLTYAVGPAGPELYATDFHNNKVDVYDSNWNPVQIPGAFVDPKLPNRYAPFGIQAVQVGATTWIVVTYARQDKAREDDRPGPGKGFVDIYDTAGTFVARAVTRDDLDSPWGVALAPANFGPFSNDLLIGNFGDGRINAYSLQPDGTFEHEGTMRGPDGKEIVIDGLWSLQFGHGNLTNNGPVTTLFFTAGPNDESDGLFGSITAS
jgi:uncharacterized protein (TIGR03118 family)